MRPGRTLSTVVFTLYLLVAGTMPVLDAMLERIVDVAVSDRRPLDDAPGTPHGDSCPLCVVIDRTPALTVVAGEIPPPVVTLSANAPWLDSLVRSANPLTPALGARAPPTPLA